ncbi:ricin-type beta-trefoil lectin domain protein [Nocardia sp. CNY236]|uniref:RICIN domain-containing protein n=1 Tax=Nocardia sp. CNY236 TaxID=1169152 RepID=UPI0009DDE28B|nr:ricin-type beta-trefoil lectin domain protein [Nocardia sp. CNY236]
MNQIFKRVLKAALPAITTSALMVGLSAPNGFAAENENTWVKNRYSKKCLYAANDGAAKAGTCRSGQLNQLWDRRDDGTIRKAFSNQCLDSNHTGQIYYLECNGGAYQLWESFSGTTKVRNVATGRYLSYDVSGVVHTSTNASNSQTDWTFGGGS